MQYLFSLDALACSCAEPPPPCAAVGYSDLVFLGTVSGLNVSPENFRTVRMTVDRAFKGALNQTIDLFDDGMCAGPLLQLGKQYLMYTSGSPNSPVPARGCTRSRRLEDAAEDLAFLEQYRVGKTPTHVDGTVRFEPEQPDDTSPTDETSVPLKDVRVTLDGNGTQLSAMTTSAGRYSFSNLAAGEYTVQADLAGYRIRAGPSDSVSLATNGCAEANIWMEVDRRVQSIVRDDADRPVAGARVEMISTKPNLKKWKQSILLDFSDETGHYTIDGIRPGEYYLGVNVHHTPTKESPYPRTFYPNTSDIRAAAPLAVPQGASVQELNLRIDRKLRVIRIHGRVETVDGRPPLPKDHAKIRIKEPGLFGQIEPGDITIDTEGCFEVELCEGIAYSAFAFSGSIPSRTTMYSAPVEFTASKNDPLVLALNETAEEFLKLRRK